jgi:hypothetical protein
MYINDFNTVAGAVDLQEDNNVRHEHFANFHRSLLLLFNSYSTSTSMVVVAV